MIPGGEVSFGVAFRNGLAQPWTSGPEPPMDLAQNGGLSGSAAWSGALLGATPSGEVVVGDSSLAVDLADLGGQLDFTDMQFDGGGRWEDGDLGYSVEVRGKRAGTPGWSPALSSAQGTREWAAFSNAPGLSAGFGGKR